MKYLFVKDYKRRQKFLKFEKKRIIIKYLLNFKNLNLINRIFLTEKLQKLPNNSSITRLRNRCISSNRSRSVNKNYKLSRIRLREYLRYGLVPGYKKSIW